MEGHSEGLTRNCVIKKRVNPKRFRDKVYVGCGAGFGGDRPLAALKLLQRVDKLNYLVLECLAERTLSDRYQEMTAGRDGFDPRIPEWIRLLLPMAMERGTCIITNMGAVDPLGAQEKVLQAANSLGLQVTVAVVREVSLKNSGSDHLLDNAKITEGGLSTYLGAAPVVECLENYQPDVVITSRLADAALFLAPMVYELGWNWDDLDLLAQGSVAGHLLECGCQLTGGYFMHSGDKNRNITLPQLLDLSLPYAEVSFDGQVCVAKAAGSGGVLNLSTCAQQLLYEVGDPQAYVMPDIVIDVRDVKFHPLSGNKVLCLGAKPSTEPVPAQLLQLVPKDAGWKGWGEISYCGFEAVSRAQAAEFLVKSWLEETFPGLNDHILSYIIGLDSLKATVINKPHGSYLAEDIRLRMDGSFEVKEHAIQFVKEFNALYTNGPAGGGGISTGYKNEIVLMKNLVDREDVFWKIGAKTTALTDSSGQLGGTYHSLQSSFSHRFIHPSENKESAANSLPTVIHPAPAGVRIPLYEIAHSRAGDKGNDLNFSVIPHCPSDINRLKPVITPSWVKEALSVLLNPSTFPDPDAIMWRNRWIDENVTVQVYEVRGISSLNVIVRNILDGGVNRSRRIDRHGKTISDLILCQKIVLSFP
ncbi:hypothetical protein MLD38_020797 [Melastoma candidum]|uniref:Uncharacterized protein n=1 Tax=Melastoma candidum TaxID=119954 RepID=A0ACB9QDE6_9MYRT|nr:hypothetical protein MLD38_020797 [Melastoma candidum]